MIQFERHVVIADGEVRTLHSDLLCETLRLGIGADIETGGYCIYILEDLVWSTKPQTNAVGSARPATEEERLEFCRAFGIDPK